MLNFNLGTEALWDYLSGINIDLEKLINTTIKALLDTNFVFKNTFIEILSSNSVKFIPTSKHKENLQAWSTQRAESTKGPTAHLETCTEHNIKTFSSRSIGR